MSNGLDSYSGLRSLVEAYVIQQRRRCTEVSARMLLPLSVLQAFQGQLELRRISSDRKGRIELAEVLGKLFSPTGTFTNTPSFPCESISKVILRSELVGEFEKQGLSTEDSLRAAEVFLEMAKKGVL